MEKPDVLKPQVVSVCPSCGLTSADSPHGTSELCIRALEAEIQRLSALLNHVKRAPKKNK